MERQSQKVTSLTIEITQIDDSMMTFHVVGNCPDDAAKEEAIHILELKNLVQSYFGTLPGSTIVEGNAETSKATLAAARLISKRRKEK